MLLNLLPCPGQPPQQRILIQPKMSTVLRFRNLHLVHINTHIIKHKNVILSRVGLKAQDLKSSIAWIISGDQV